MSGSSSSRLAQYALKAAWVWMSATQPIPASTPKPKYSLSLIHIFFRHVQRLSDVPGDEVHIATVEAGGPADEGEHLRSVHGGEQFLQLVPEVENLFRSFLLPQGIQGIAEKARYRSVGMEIVHKVVVGIQIAVDERHTAGGTGDVYKRQP